MDYWTIAGLNHQVKLSQTNCQTYVENCNVQVCIKADVDEKDGKDEKVMTYLLHKAQTKTKLVWRSDR